jgi:cytochrome c-type biogenesis protein CcmH
VTFFQSVVRPEGSAAGAQSKDAGASLLRLRSARTLLLFTVLAVGATPAHPQSNRPPAPYAYQQLADPKQEARATALMQELRCLVCQGQSIHDSDAEMAGDMRHLVRTRIEAGESPEEVRSWLVGRYGSWVSYQPRLEGDTLALWLAPLALLLAGGWLAFRRFKVRR